MRRVIVIGGAGSTVGKSIAAELLAAAAEQGYLLLTCRQSEQEFRADFEPVEVQAFALPNKVRKSKGEKARQRSEWRRFAKKA